MSWAITRTDDTIRLDLVSDLDSQGRPRNHRVFEYSLTGDPAFRQDDGALYSDTDLADEVRKRARLQLASEAAASPTPTEGLEGSQVEVASGERL